MDIKRLLCLYLKSSDAILLKTLSLYFVFTITPNQNKFYFVKTTKEENLKYEYNLQMMQAKTINIETMVAAQLRVT